MSSTNDSSSANGDSEDGSYADQLAIALREKEELRRTLEEYRRAVKNAEVERDRNAAAAKSAIDELQQFVYAASHDLQEPLRSIATYTQLLQRHCASNQEAEELASFVIEGVSRMNTLIRDLLTYSRIGTEMRRTTVNLAAVLQWALLKETKTIQDAGAQITYADLPEVQVDESKMATVFENLVNNALKFRGSETPKVEVSVDEGEDFYTIAVRDNGAGIEPRFHDLVFVPFKRLHGKEIPGSGLGLAYCRKIVEAHGGKIWVESDGKTGSVFKFTIPM